LPHRHETPQKQPEQVAALPPDVQQIVDEGILVTRSVLCRSPRWEMLDSTGIIFVHGFFCIAPNHSDEGRAIIGSRD